MNWFQLKISTKYYCRCHLFDPWSPFFEKWLCPQSKVIMANFFVIEISFWNTFWTILNRFRFRKNLAKNFCRCHFFDLWPPIFDKWRCPQRQVIMYFFLNRDFHFKICLGPFWIYSDQKKIEPKFSPLPFFN